MREPVDEQPVTCMRVVNSSVRNKGQTTGLRTGVPQAAGLRTEPGQPQPRAPRMERFAPRATMPLVQARMWLIDLAALLYAISMHKFAVRDALSSGSGIQGVIEAGGLSGALCCVLSATWGMRRERRPSMGTICFSIIGIFALASSFRSYSPAASLVKGILYFAVLGNCYILNQTRMAERFLRSLYRSYVGLLLIGLVAGVLLPNTYPLLQVDDFSGRQTMGVFDTFFGVIGEDTALMILVAPLIFKKTPWLSGVFLFVMNVLAGSKTSTLLLIPSLTIRFLLSIRRWYSWKAVIVVTAMAALGVMAVLKPLQREPVVHQGKGPAQAIYGNQINENAGGLDGRVGLWMGAITILPEAQLLGFGFDGARDRMLKIASWSGSSHNSYLEVALAAGLFAFLFYLVALVQIGRSCAGATGDLRRDAMLLFGFLLINTIVGITLFNPVYIGLLLLLWLPYRLTAEQQTSNTQDSQLPYGAGISSSATRDFQPSGGSPLLKITARS